MPAVMAGIALAGAPDFAAACLFAAALIGLTVYFRYLEKHCSKRAVMYDLLIILIPVMMLFGRGSAVNALSRPGIGCEIGKKSEISAYGIVKDRSLQEGKAVLTVIVGKIEDPLEPSHVFFDQTLIVYSDETNEQPDVMVGDQITFSGKLYPLKKATNPGQFDMQSYCRARNIDGKVYGAAFIVTDHHDSLKNSISEMLAALRIKIDEALDKSFEEDDAGVLRAMLTGDKSLMDDDLNELYRQAGIGHILAISGLHISMIGLFFFELLKKSGVSLKINAIISETVVILYCVMTGMSISSLRALVMFSCVMLARSIGKSYDSLSAMGLAGTVLLLLRPLQMFEAGFVLSFVSVVGIACFGKPSAKIAAFIGARLQDRFLLWNKKFVESLERRMQELILGLCLYLVMLPVIAWYYYEVSPYSFLLNLLILPFMSPLIAGSFISVGIGMGAAMLSKLFVPLAKVLGYFSVFFGSVPHLILTGYQKAAAFAVSLPGGVVLTGRPDGVVMLICVSCILAACIFVRKKTKAAALLLVSLGILFVRIPQGDSVTFLDVGQGDCAVIRSGARTIMIDGGSSDNSSVGKYVISQYLKYSGISRVDYCFVTHPDSDHMNGIVELVQKMDVPKRGSVKRSGNVRRSYKGSIIIGQLILPDVSELDEEFADLISLAEERQIEMVRINSQMKFVSDSDCVFECLNPSESINYESANSASIVLLMRSGDLSILFAGDVENEGEDEVISELRKRGVRDVTIYKAAHHGSSNGTNSKELVELLRPKVTIISCGRNNRYNHPHAETISNLEEVGSRMVITWEEGYQRFDFCN